MLFIKFYEICNDFKIINSSASKSKTVLQNFFIVIFLKINTSDEFKF